MSKTVAVIVICASLSLPALAHGGRLDSLGCHNDRVHGGYHCHQGALAGQSFATKTEALQALQARRTPPSSTESTREPYTVGNANTRVWVNTNSGVYHCPGTRWYGATKVGQYMSQKDAQAKGYRAAYGRVCQ